MRVFAHTALAGCLAGVVIAFGDVAGQSRDAAGVLAAARQALGGESRLSSVKSFTATGRTRQVRGDNLVPIEVEILVELPDKYLRKEEIPAQETGITASGFNGDQLLQEPPPAAPAPPAGAPGRAANPAALEAARKSRLTAAKQDFARMALGMFAGSFAAYPLTFTYAGEAEAPQGKADVLDAKGPDNFTIRLFVSQQTHLPLMVSWQGAAGRGRAPAPAAPVQNRLYYADYREVDGLQLPFRLRRAVGADTIEETTFDKFRLNAKIDPRRFAGRQ